MKKSSKEETTEQLDFIPAKVQVVQHIRFKYDCKACEETIKTAKRPSILSSKVSRALTYWHILLPPNSAFIFCYADKKSFYNE